MNEIVVGLDNSVPAVAALDWAAAEARQSGSALRAVHVLDWPTGVGADGRPLVLEDLVQLQGADVDSAIQRRITELFERVRPDPAWSLHFVRGKTGRMLVDAAGNARLLVVGTGEHVGLGRVLLGSTSHYVSATPRVRWLRFRQRIVTPTYPHQATRVRSRRANVTALPA